MAVAASLLLVEVVHEEADRGGWESRGKQEETVAAATAEAGSSCERRRVPWSGGWVACLGRSADLCLGVAVVTAWPHPALVVVVRLAV